MRSEKIELAKKGIHLGGGTPPQMDVPTATLFGKKRHPFGTKRHPFGGGVSPIWDVLYRFGLIFLPVKTVLVTLFGGFGLYYNTYSIRSETLFTLDYI